MSEIQKANRVTAIIGKEAYRTEIQVGAHTIISDEPKEIGGEDLGPSPGDFLRISLATCTAITLRMYSNRKGFDVSHIAVDVTSDQAGGKTIFNVEIKIDGNLNEAQRSRMLQIANACPIHKTLENPIEVLTSIVQ